MEDLHDVSLNFGCQYGLPKNTSPHLQVTQPARPACWEGPSPAEGKVHASFVPEVCTARLQQARCMAAAKASHGQGSRSGTEHKDTRLVPSTGGHIQVLVPCM